MKSLKHTIQESLNKIGIYESLRIGINDKPREYYPTTFKELRQIIEQRYEEEGPGTKDNPINFNDIDVSEITSFCDDDKEILFLGIFQHTEFEYIDVSEWNVSNVENMQDMFYNCQLLKEIDLSNWDVSNVTNMSTMFVDCRNLKSVGDLSNWDVSNVEYMNHMFDDCKEEIIPNWYKKMI